MRRLLVVIIALECTALLGGGVVHLAGGLERFQKRLPPPPSFKPPLHEAVIGDFVRYRRLDPESGEVIGYLDYEVSKAFEYKGTTLGREFIMKMTERDAAGKTRSRLIRVRPRAVGHGFLPPRFEEEDGYPQGARPVVQTIRPAQVPFFKWEVDGFLIEAVVPRESLTDVAERFWVTSRVPVFGISRWERKDEVLEIHTLEKS